MKPPFTGRHMAIILVAGFGVIIAVNLLMAGLAVGTFGGVVVENSYVASQRFNRWLDEADRSQALGWDAALVRAADGRLVATFAAGPPPGSMTLSGRARHPLGRRPDMALDFAPDGKGGFVSRQPLPEGRWIVRLEAASDGHVWRSERTLT